MPPATPMHARLLITSLTTVSLFVPHVVTAGGPQVTRNATTRPVPQKFERYQVAAGTALLLKLRTPLDSATAAVDQQVDATIWSPVIQDGVELIPSGSVVFGRVTAVDRATYQKPLGLLTITFSIVEHAETGDRASVNTRSIVVEAAPPAPPPGKKARPRPTDAVLAEGAPLVAVTAEPLLVRIPK